MSVPTLACAHGQSEDAYDIAEELLVELLEDCSATFGTRHEVTLRVLAKLAMLLHAMGRTAEAEELYVRLVLQGAPPEE